MLKKLADDFLSVQATQQKGGNEKSEFWLGPRSLKGCFLLFCKP